MKIFFTTALLFLSLVMSARDVARGYRGFFEIDGSLTSWRVADSYEFNPTSGIKYHNIHRQAFGEVSFATSHGYQFNPRFFLGAGLMGGYSGIHDGWFLGTYLHARTDQTFGRYTPYAEIRTGIVTHAEGGLYLSPAVGYRFNFGHRTNINVGIGLTLRHTGGEDTTGSFYYNSQGDLIHITLGKDPIMKPYATLRVGIDF